MQGVDSMQRTPLYRAVHASTRAILLLSGNFLKILLLGIRTA